MTNMNKYIVEYSGYTEVEASNKEEAIEVVNQHLYNLDMSVYTLEEWNAQKEEKPRRYVGIIGFNTKQIWVYDEEEDVFIDPPAKVLKDLPDWREDPDAALKEIEEIANGKLPKWLFDYDYWYEIDDI